jgi:hypothetical protein
MWLAFSHLSLGLPMLARRCRARFVPMKYTRSAVAIFYTVYNPTRTHPLSRRHKIHSSRRSALPTKAPAARSRYLKCFVLRSLSLTPSQSSSSTSVCGCCCFCVYKRTEHTRKGSSFGDIERENGEARGLIELS